MLASYILSRTLVPTLAMYLLKEHQDAAKSSSNPFVRFQQSFERAFHESPRLLPILARASRPTPPYLHPSLPPRVSRRFPPRPLARPGFLSPARTGGQFQSFTFAQRPEPASRKPQKLSDEVENTAIRRAIFPNANSTSIADNIGLPYSAINYMHSTLRPQSAPVMRTSSSLSTKIITPPPPTCANSANSCPRNFPGSTFYFLPADITTQILNFGPSPLPWTFRSKVRTRKGIAA